MIENIFENELKERGIFKDLAVLSPHYIPQELPHREEETKDISKIIAPILRNEKPNNIFIYGKTGTGKSCVVKYVIRKLGDIVRDSSKNPNNSEVVVVYMNCRVGYDSKYQVLVKILEDPSLQKDSYKNTPLRDRPDKKLSGLNPTELYERLKRVVESNNINLIVVLDEIDMVKDIDDLTYILTRINDEIISGHVSIIGISNRYTFKENLDQRSKSTLCEEERVFKPYNANQLKTILHQRVKLGFQPRSISDSHIALIAAYAAQTNGDARYALKLLQKSGEIAQSSKRKRVRIDDVKEAKLKVEEDIVGELITTLPEHQQIVLYSIAEIASRGSHYKRLSDMPTDVLFSGEVYESYEKVCRNINKNPRSMRWFREYLNDLEMLGLITHSPSGKGVRGNTTLIRLGNPPDDVKKIVTASLGLA